MTGIETSTSGTEQITIAEWTAKLTQPDYKITAHENGDGWLVLLQKKIANEWTVEESFHASHKPVSPDSGQSRDGDRQ